MITSIFSPSTVRKSKGIKKRLQAQKRVARDRYKLAQEQAEAIRYKTKAEVAKDSSASDQSDDSKATFFYDSTGENTEEEDDEALSKTSSAATGDIYRNKKHLLGNFFQKFVYKSIKFELKTREFLCIMFSVQVPLVHLIHHVFVLNIWGATLVLLLFSVLEIVVAMPLYMVYMFLGNYGRRCYIKFWDFVPLFKGMAYSIAMTNLISQLLNVAFSSLALLYMKNMIAAEVPWMKCNFPNAHRDCVPTYGTHEPYTVICCDEDDLIDVSCKDRIHEMCFKYGAADYYNSYILQKGYVSVHQENMILWKWAIAAVIEWLIIFILLSLGLRKFRGFMIITHLVLMLLIILPGSLLTVIVSSKFSVISQAQITYDILHETNVLFWLQTGVHILNSEVPGDVITFSSLSKPTQNVTLNTVLIYTLKVLFLTLLSVWLSVFVTKVQNHYNVKEAFCIRAGGDQLIFAVTPDVLSRWPVPQLWLFLYFLIVFLWGLASTSYVLSSFIEAILEEFPILFKWRIILTGLLSISACTVNIFFLRPNFMNAFSYIILHVLVYVKAAQLFLSLVAVFIYSLESYKNDYHFNYGIMLIPYWVHSLKIGLIILGVLFTLMYTLGIKNLAKRDVYFVTGLISPILIGMILCTVRYLLRLRATLLDPDPKWGPVILKKKVARARFDPTHELHFRSTLHTCKHKCLLTSVALKKEMKHWQSKQIIYNQQLVENQNFDEKKAV